MKTSSFFKSVMIVSLFMTMAFSVKLNAANESRRVTNNLYDEQNNITSTVIYNNDENTLIPVYRYDFKYDDQKRIVEKQTLKWSEGKWANCFMVDVTYNNDSANIKYSIWNEGKKQYVKTSEYDCGIADVETNIK